LHARESLFDPGHDGALRLFNGFYEGWPELVVDIYGRTLLLSTYAEPSSSPSLWLPQVQAYFLETLPWLKTALVKARKAKSPEERRGMITFGGPPDRQIQEFNVSYALDLTMNQDASFYLDTRQLRAWILDNLAGKSVLNAFAYTGSLGVAARAAGVSRVVFLDHNRRFLQLARDSLRLNGFTVDERDFIVADFFPAASRMRRAGERFDCVILDPPFYSTTGKGTVDLLKRNQALINKARPLVNDGGKLVAINNALFLEGSAYHESLQAISSEGYLSIEELIPVPEDVTGFPHTIVRRPPADSSPFNHPTKIAVLQIRHKK